MFRKIGKKTRCLVGAVAVVAMSAGNAFAAGPWIDVSSISVDTDSVGTMGATVLAGLALIWGLRKLIKTINRS